MINELRVDSAFKTALMQSEEGKRLVEEVERQEIVTEIKRALHRALTDTRHTIGCFQLLSLANWDQIKQAIDGLSNQQAGRLAGYAKHVIAYQTYPGYSDLQINLDKDWRHQFWVIMHERKQGK